MKKNTLILHLDCVEKKPDSQLMGKELYFSNRSGRNIHVFCQVFSKIIRKPGEKSQVTGYTHQHLQPL